MLYLSLVLSRANFSRVWRCHAIPFLRYSAFLSFFVQSQRLNRTLGWEQFPSQFGWLFWNFHSRSYSISAILIVLPQELWGTLTTAFERHLTVEHFMDICANIFLGIYHKTKTGKSVWEIISCSKISACSSKNIAPRNFTCYCILLFLSNKPSF